MEYHHIEKARQVILFPLRLIIYLPKILVVLPFTAVVALLMTNWEDEWDRDYYFESLKNLTKF